MVALTKNLGADGLLFLPFFLVFLLFTSITSIYIASQRASNQMTPPLVTFAFLDNASSRPQMSSDDLKRVSSGWTSDVERDTGFFR